MKLVNNNEYNTDPYILDRSERSLKSIPEEKNKIQDRLMNQCYHRKMSLATCLEALFLEVVCIVFQKTK